jgi:hypothetical protein
LEATYSYSTLDFEATDLFEATDFKLTGSCSKLDLKAIVSFKHGILKK